MADGEGASERFGSDASVKQCLVVMDAVLAEQRARARHLDTKAASITGFCATALALNVALGRPLLEQNLGSFGGTLVHAAFLLAAVALAGAALAASVGGLFSMGHQDLTEKQIDAYSDRPKVVTPAEDLRMTWLRTLTEMTQSVRSVGDTKADWTNRAVRLLLIGIFAIVGQAAIVVIA